MVGDDDEFATTTTTTTTTKTPPGLHASPPHTTLQCYNSTLPHNNNKKTRRPCRLGFCNCAKASVRPEPPRSDGLWARGLPCPRAPGAVAAAPPAARITSSSPSSASSSPPFSYMVASWSSANCRAPDVSAQVRTLRHRSSSCFFSLSSRSPTGVVSRFQVPRPDGSGRGLVGAANLRSFFTTCSICIRPMPVRVTLALSRATAWRSRSALFRAVAGFCV